MFRRPSIFPLFLLLAGLLLSSCDNGIEVVDVNATPPAVQGVRIGTGPGVLTLHWNFLDEVSPQLTFSGYLVYMTREDFTGNDAGFQVWRSFITRAGSGSYLPLLKRTNSLSDDHMEVEVVGLQSGKLHKFYVVGVQNGHDGPASSEVSDVPFARKPEIRIREEKRDIPDWYIVGYGNADLRDPAPDRVGYRYEPFLKEHYLRWQSIEDGGWLRIRKGGPNAAKEDAPEDGYIDSPAANRIEIDEGDHIFVWNTNGTPENPGDDHYSRILIENIVEIQDHRALIIECDYQPRPNTPNL
ncbi:MAG: hypothetical protein ABIK65_02780 [Candidatus Eisenbacteria bacterium]